MRRLLGVWALLCPVMFLVQACGYGVADCEPNDHKVCREGVTYWADSCGNEGDKAGDCECGCNADLTGCKDPCECTPECAGRCCGPNGCDGTCPNTCPSGYVCNAQLCECEPERECETNADCPMYHWCDRTVWECKPVECTPNCTGKCCGPDGCGGTCSDNCPAGYVCDAQFCACEPGRECETNSDCPQGYWCDRTVWQCKEIDCIPNCTGKCCGSDGCGGTCPNNCPTGYECNMTTCQCETTGCQTSADCMMDQCCRQGVCIGMSCGSLECGPDPVCGFACGPCGAGTHCDMGVCVQDIFCTSDAQCLANECCINTICTPMACGGLECGPDPVCGKECGPCTPPEICQSGRCIGGGSGELGDPCTFGTVNAAAGECNAGLACLGVMADGNAGTCLGGSASECTNLLEEWNRDCVAGNCGASFCSEPCDAQRNCPQGFVGQDVGNPPQCMCIPTPSGSGQPGDPCPWGNVNASYDDCGAGLNCLGNDDIGPCPGGSAAECSGVEDSWNPDCVSGICGFSFCSDTCDAQGNCPAGFTPVNLVGTCYCIPA